MASNHVAVTAIATSLEPVVGNCSTLGGTVTPTQNVMSSPLAAVIASLRRWEPAAKPRGTVTPVDSRPFASTVNSPRLVGVEKIVADAELPGASPPMVRFIDEPGAKDAADPIDEVGNAIDRSTFPIRPVKVDPPDQAMLDGTSRPPTMVTIPPTGTLGMMGAVGFAIGVEVLGGVDAAGGATGVGEGAGGLLGCGDGCCATTHGSVEYCQRRNGRPSPSQIPHTS